MAFFYKNFGQKLLFRLLRSNHPETWNLQAHFLPGGGRKGRLGASSLSERLAPSPDHAKVLERRHHVHTCMRGRSLDCSHRAWWAHGARRQRWRATWDWHTEFGVVSDGPRRDRVRRWWRGGGTRRRRACPGVTRRDASSCCCLARRRAGPFIRELWTFCTLFRHSRAQYDEFEKCFACMMTVWVVWGDRGLAMYVVMCQNKTQHNQMFCVLVLNCLQYGKIC